MSKDVLKACGSEFINKYAEGYSGNRYYGGCEIVDELEDLANRTVQRLFNCSWSNVQPNSGCQANQAVYMALLEPNDKILAMDINSGGHISHSLPIGFAGTFYNVSTYGLDESGYLNYGQIEEMLYSINPQLLIVGGSAYPRTIDFERIRKIVDKYNESHDKCYMMVDMAHIAGLVAAGVHPSPLPFADVVTSTVQKTLRAGRGGLILSNDKELGKRIDKAIFPRLQGGPLVNMIAGKAVGFMEALKPEFKEYQEQVILNTKAMEKVFKMNDIKMISGGSDNHLILLDLRQEPFSGNDLEKYLKTFHIVVNKNAVQNDMRWKTETSGVRIGTAAITTRGAKEDDAEAIAYWICGAIENMRENNIKYLGCVPMQVLNVIPEDTITHWCEDHPIYPMDGE